MRSDDTTEITVRLEGTETVVTVNLPRLDQAIAGFLAEGHRAERRWTSGRRKSVYASSSRAQGTPARVSVAYPWGLETVCVYPGPAAEDFAANLLLPSRSSTAFCQAASPAHQEWRRGR